MPENKGYGIILNEQIIQNLMERYNEKGQLLCHAHSQQTGNLCTRPAKKSGVCFMHGADAGRPITKMDKRTLKKTRQTEAIVGSWVYEPSMLNFERQIVLVNRITELVGDALAKVKEIDPDNIEAIQRFTELLQGCSKVLKLKHDADNASALSARELVALQMQLTAFLSELSPEARQSAENALKGATLLQMAVDPLTLRCASLSESERAVVLQFIKDNFDGRRIIDSE